MYGKSISNKEVIPTAIFEPWWNGTYKTFSEPRQTLSLILQLPTLPFLYHEKMYKFDGNKYPDSTFAYSAKSSDITDIKEHQVGILINDSDESSTAIRSYRGFNPTGGDVLYVENQASISESSRFFFVRPNTDIYGLITNDINPIYLDISGNTLATLGMTSGGASVDYKLYDTGTLTVSLSSQDSSIAYVNSATYSGSGYMFLSGIQANDFVMVASVATSDDTGTITATNAGTITKDQVNADSNPYHAVHYFHATGTYTEINVYSGNWIAIAFRNVNTTTPLDVTTTKNSSGSRPNPPAITTSTDDTMIVAFGFIDDQSGVDTLTAPSGYTQAAYNYNSSYNASVMAIYKALPSAGTDDPGQFGGDTDSVTAMTFALRGIVDDAPSNIDTGTSFQWYYSTVENQKGYLSQEGLISYPITGQNTKNYIPSASGTPGSTAKSVRCGVTYASGAKTVYSQWTPTNTYYYALATTSGAPELAPGNSGSFVLSGYVGTPTTLYYSIDEPSGASYSLSGSDFANGSISGTVSVSGNSVAIPIRTTTSGIRKPFNVNIRQDSTSGTIIGTSSSITSDFKSSGNAAPSLGRSFITSGNYDDNASSWAGTGWQNIFSGVPNSSNIGSNNISAEVALGFDFKIDGNTYTSVYVTSHAWLQFGTGASTTSAAGSGVARLRVANNDESTSSTYYIVRAAKFVTSNYVTLRLEYGNQSTRTFNQTREITGADGQGFICIEVTFLKGDVYGTPIIETRVGQSHFFTSAWQQSYSGYGWVTDYTQNFYSDSGSTTLAEHSTAQDTSTLLVANDANGNSWTAYSAAGLASAESYALSHSGNATEGNTYAFTLATSNVTNGSTLYYDIVAGDSGNTPTAADFEGITSLTGNSFSTTNDSTTINLYPINDGSSSEGEGEVFKLRITDVPGSLGGQLALSNSVTLVDGGVVSYSVSPSATIVNEGGSITFTVNTSNVVDTTTLYYTIDSNTNGALYGSSSDFTSSLSGTIGNISSNTVSKAITIATDSLYEPAETFYFSVRTGSTSGTIVARSSQITISEATTVLGSHSTNQLINSTKQFTINTTNAANNTLYWFITSNSAGTTMYGDSNDFTTALSGAVTVNSSGDSITLNIITSNSSSIGDQYYLAIKSTENLSASNEAISSQITIASATYNLAVNTTTPYISQSATFTLTTSGVNEGTTLRYYITSNSSGTTQYSDSNDFTSSLTGTFTVNNNTATITIQNSSSSSNGETYYLAIKNSSDAVNATSLENSNLITITEPPYIVPTTNLVSHWDFSNLSGSGTFSAGTISNSGGTNIGASSNTPSLTAVPYSTSNIQVGTVNSRNTLQFTDGPNYRYIDYVTSGPNAWEYPSGGSSSSDVQYTWMTVHYYPSTNAWTGYTHYHAFYQSNASGWEWLGISYLAGVNNPDYYANYPGTDRLVNTIVPSGFDNLSRYAGLHINMWSLSGTNINYAVWSRAYSDDHGGTAVSNIITGSTTIATPTYSDSSFDNPSERLMQLGSCIGQNWSNARRNPMHFCEVAWWKEAFTQSEMSSVVSDAITKWNP